MPHCAQTMKTSVNNQSSDPQSAQVYLGTANDPVRSILLLQAMAAAEESGKVALPCYCCGSCGYILKNKNTSILSKERLYSKQLLHEKKRTVAIERTLNIRSASDSYIRQKGVLFQFLFFFFTDRSKQSYVEYKGGLLDQRIFYPEHRFFSEGIIC